MPLGINTGPAGPHFFPISMKKIAFLIAAAFVTIGSAHAQTFNAPAQKQARFFLGMGFTGGGDKIAEVQYTNGDKGDVTFGSLIQLGGGFDYRVNEQLSLQASLNYHVSSEGADNGAIRFTRVPVELIGYYHVSPQWRIGVGARHVSNAKITSSGIATMPTLKFEDTMGGILEAEYMMGGQIGIKLRYVAEKYEFSGVRQKASGNHVGLLANWYF